MTDLEKIKSAIDGAGERYKIYKDEEGIVIRQMINDYSLRAECSDEPVQLVYVFSCKGILQEMYLDMWVEERNDSKKD